MISITSNSSGRTHAERLADLLVGAEEALLVSPFVFDDFEPWVRSVDFTTLRGLTLVTTLAPRGDDQLRKPAALLSLIRALRTHAPATRVRIQLDERLHGKIYLAGRVGRMERGIVTSANLTRSGLHSNHEWGFYTEDLAVLEELRRQVDATVEYPELSEELLEYMLLCVDSYERANGTSSRPDIDVGLKHALSRAPRRMSVNDVLAAGVSQRRVFLKPWGTAAEPLRKADREPFDSLEEDLSFPKRPEPRDVRSGDIVIVFATGDRSVVSVYRVLREASERSADEQARDPIAARWPWFVKAQNVTPGLGGRWWEVDLTIDALLEGFHDEMPDAPVSNAGGTGLGTFGFGAGRLRLSDDFGEYALRRLLALEQEHEA